VAAYTIDVRPRARRSLQQLDPSVQKAIAEVIDGLAADPRPPGSLPLTGHRPYLRVRSGDDRVVYTVDDSARVVTIAAAGHRSRDLPQARPVAGGRY
jgi:mRNA interferase RelE/StbE